MKSFISHATKEGITDAIEAARSQVRSGGTLWFVFIGHGAPSEDGQDGLLVGWDTQQTASSVYARGLMQGEVLDLLESGNQSQTVAILDACFSGQSGADTPLVAGLQPMIPSYALSSSSRSTVVLSAGTSKQFDVNNPFWLSLTNIDSEPIQITICQSK